MNPDPGNPALSALIAAGAVNVFSRSGTIFGPLAHQLLFEVQRGWPDPRDLRIDNARPFAIYRDTGYGHVRGTGRPEFSLDEKAADPAAAVTLAGSDGVIVI